MRESIPFGIVRRPPRRPRNKKVKVLLFGVGAIGSDVAKYSLTKKWLQITGAIDSDPAKAGRDLGEVIGLGRKIGIRISGDPRSPLQRGKADIAVLTTGSFFEAAYPQLENLARAGMNVITTAEELAFPSLRHARLAHRLDRIAKRAGISLMAGGVNPGFVMDALLVYLARACLEVTSIRAKRIVDISRRRKQLQLKVGAGLSIQEFKASLGRTIFGHVGLLESAALVADELGMRPDGISQKIEPIPADQAVATDHVHVGPGQVAGIRQRVQCLQKGVARVMLEIEFFVGAKEPKDEIHISGTPPIDMTIEHGIFGDHATVALLINSIPAVLQAKPGLLTATGKSVSEIRWKCPVDPGY